MKLCDNKQRQNLDKCRCECKELIGKWICNKKFIWNPTNSESECVNYVMLENIQTIKTASV